MSAIESRVFRSRPQHSSPTWARLVFRGVAVATFSLALASACSSSGNGGNVSGNGGNGSTNSGSGTNYSNGNSNSNSTNTGSGTNYSNGGSNSTNTGSGSGNTGNGSGNTGNGSGNTGNGSGNTGNGSGNTGSGSGNTGNNSGITDGGGDSTVSPADGSSGCTNTDTSVINIDSSGWACNNQWDIEGAWYCYADSDGTSDCGGTGAIPYKAASSGMCISGTTSTSTSGAYGAAIGLVLNQVAQNDADKLSYNATAKNIVGFAITVTGTTGGSVLNVNFPFGGKPGVTSTGENPAVTLPGVSSGSSPITYNVMIADAIISDNTTAFPATTVNASELNDIQVAIPSSDGIAHAYNYCVTKIVPITATAAAPATQGNYGPAFNEGKQIVLEGLGPYGIQNDPVGMGTDPISVQATYGGGQIGFSATPSFNTVGSNTPGAFPSIVYGWINGANVLGASEGGYAANKSIGSLTSVKSNWSYTAGSGSWDAAYDTWLAGSADPLTAGYELMVWLGHGSVNPIGAPGTSVTVSGATWTVSEGTNHTGQPVVSYLSPSNMASVTDFDLLPFFQEAATSHRGTGGPNNEPAISTSTILLSVQAGFELYESGTWTTNSYSISIQ
jgi:hypothetical protein